MKNVVVIFGSKSKEHEVSCISAGNILENIDKNKFSVYMIGIDKEGNWFNYTGNIKNILKNKWIEDNENKEKIVDIMKELKKYDIAFPVLHGKYGEDGTIQGLFELIDIKYVGAGVLGSSICMDKEYAKIFVKQMGINIVDYIVFKNTDNIKAEDIKIPFELPVIIKPAREGSSYGIFKVTDKSQLAKAIKETFKFDDKILIEKYISNRLELECAVMGNRKKIEVAGPCQITIKDGFYDYNTKYIENKANIKISADISETLKKEVREMSKNIYQALDLKGLARIDFFLDKSDNKIYFNEANTLPGFTKNSMFPKMFIKQGLQYKDLITKLIEYGLE